MHGLTDVERDASIGVSNSKGDREQEDVAQRNILHALIDAREARGKVHAAGLNKARMAELLQ